MPNVAKVLREEMTRLGRKEAKAAFTPLRKRTIKLERSAAALKKRVAVLEKENKRLQAEVKKLLSAQSVVSAPVAQSGAWFTGRGVKGLRTRLGLSQPEFARLAGVSDQAVYVWEHKPGLLKFRGGAAKAALLAIRGIGRAEARKRLEAAEKAKKPKARRRRRK